MKWNYLIPPLVLYLFCAIVIKYLRGTDSNASSSLSLNNPLENTPRKLIFLGQTGAGKSTLCNEVSGTDYFEVGHSMDSCTSSISTTESYLFGDSTTGMKIEVADIGGLGDSNGRDDVFLDELATHMKEFGVHGIVYVHNACNKRFDKQARESLRTTVQTLTLPHMRGDLSKRLVIMLTQCTKAYTRLLYEQQMPTKLCEQFQLCDVPLLWFDDFTPEPPPLRSKSWFRGPFFTIFGVFRDSIWKKDFAQWIENLPKEKMMLPSESERERLKKKHVAVLDKEADERLLLEREIESAKQDLDEALLELSSLHGDSPEIVKRKKHIQALRNSIRKPKARLDKLNDPYGCFSGLTKVIDRQHGKILMKDLAIGSEVATSDGWATVTTYLHWHPDQEIPALRVSHQHGKLTLTANHLVFVQDKNGTRKELPAREILPGMRLLGSDDTKNRVIAVHSVVMEGYYAPLTSTGTILVDNVVASCYTRNDKYPALPHWAIHAVTRAASWLLPSRLSLVPEPGMIHPLVQDGHRIVGSIFG